MALASGTRVQLIYAAETTRGVIPSPMSSTIFRATSRNINPQINLLRSNEVRADRQRTTSRHGFNQIVGSPGFELSLEAYDDWLEAAMSGTWATAPDTTAAQTIDQTTITPSDEAVFVWSAGDYIAAGFRVGMTVETTGYAGASNNKVATVIEVASATSMKLKSNDGTNFGALEGGDGDERIQATGEVIDIGQVLRTFWIERGFLDVAQYQGFLGCAINQMNIQIQPEQMVGGSFDVLGMSASGMLPVSLGGTPTAAAANDPFSAFDGAVYEADGESSVVTGLNFTLNNNRSLNAVVGSKFSPDVFEGTAEIGGELTVYFEDATLYNKFFLETVSSLAVRVDDINGTDFMVFGFPSIKYSGADMDPPQQGPVPITMPFEAQVDSVSGTSMWIQKSNV